MKISKKAKFTTCFNSSQCACDFESWSSPTWCLSIDVLIAVLYTSLYCRGHVVQCVEKLGLGLTRPAGPPHRATVCPHSCVVGLWRGRKMVREDGGFGSAYVCEQFT